jgi:serine/threonine-protein kinase
VWVDRQGRETPIPAPSRSYLYPRLSADGRRVAVNATDQETDIWVWDLGRTTLTRVTFDPGIDAYPVWTPDGLRLIFSSERAGTRNLYWQAADGTGAVERLTDSPNQQNAAAVAPDGRRLIFTELAPKTADDVMQVELDGTRRVTPLVQSAFAERNGIVSPDGRWLAYEANDSGRYEIYVRPYPGPGGKWQVSTEGGEEATWSRDGNELFYRNGQKWMAAAVNLEPEFTSETPRLLFEGPYVNVGGASYDVTPDGQRFLLLEPTAQEAAPVTHLNVVLNWFEEAKQKAGPGVVQGPR